MHLNRVDRKYANLTVTATDEDGFPAALAGVDVALIPTRSNPTGATVWTAAASAGGKWRVLLAGPDASPSGALVVAATADLWIRVTDSPEVDTAFVERITVEGVSA